METRKLCFSDDEVLQVFASRATADISRRPEREGLMSSIGPKTVRLRLEQVAYERLRRQVLSRDGWRFQWCGSMSSLEVHHKQFRSRSGDDSDLNLITLCTQCHAEMHRWNSK
jgi:5-methylcytosine-specific restriction endonuclease McrA